MPSIYAALGARRNACTAYRLYTPLRSFQLSGLGTPLLEENDISDSQRESADFHLYYMRASRRILAWTHKCNRERGKLHPTKRHKAPHVIFDSDDHAEDIHMWNPRFIKLGTKLPDGTVMNRGDRIEIAYPDGATEVLWEDLVTTSGEDYFDVLENRALINLLKLQARAGSGVTCSTEYLAEVYRRYGCKNVYHYPNSFLREDYPEIKIERPKKVRILWQGGHSHYEDWLTILDPLRRVCEKRPNIEFVLWGQEFPAVSRGVPAKNYRYIPWVAHDRYTLRLATIGHHINLAPLVDNSFNRAKSSIKWSESAAITRPAATLAANVGPYQEIEHGETGLLYNNEGEFENLLLDLIDDASLRLRLARRAQECVWDKYDAMKTIKPLSEWYQSILFKDLR